MPKATAGSFQIIGAPSNRHRELVARDLTRSNGQSVEQTPDTENTIKLETVNGIGLVQWVAPQQAGLVRFFASNGQISVESSIKVDPEIRPTIMVGVGKISVGAAAPEHQLSGDQETVTGRGNCSLNPKLGPTPHSQEAMTRVVLNAPLTQNGFFDTSGSQDRMYPIFGDSSTRFNEVQSNSKLYFKVEHGQQYAMFGDFRLNGTEVGNYQGSSLNGLGLGSGIRLGSSASTLSNFSGLNTAANQAHNYRFMSGR